MENLIEKLKTVDKKVWIGVGIGAAVVIILVVALIIGLGNNKPTGSNQGGSQNGTQAGTQTEGDASEVLGSEGLGTEVIGTEMTTETEMGTETTETQGAGEGQGNGGGQLTTTKPDDVNGVEQNTVTTKPDGEEILGAGSKEEPYMEIPENMTVTTVNIPAGKTLYYSIYRVGGKYLTINDPDAYVIYKGRTYEAKNGKVSFKVKNELASTPVEFQIGNKSTTAKSFVIKFSDPQGSWGNPESVKSIVNQSTYQISLAAGNDLGYWYSYKVEQTGTIRFYVTGTAASGLEVQNDDTSSTDGATFAEEKYVKTDEQGRKYIEFAVTKGQTIYIHVCAEKVDGAYPATKITWEAKYV